MPNLWPSRSGPELSFTRPDGELCAHSRQAFAKRDLRPPAVEQVGSEAAIHGLPPDQGGVVGVPFDLDRLAGNRDDLSCQVADSDTLPGA